MPFAVTCESVSPLFSLYLAVVPAKAGTHAAPPKSIY
jgi:hypothetical protein